MTSAPALGHGLPCTSPCHPGGFVSTLEARNLQLREGKGHARRHTAGEGQSRDLLSFHHTQDCLSCLWVCLTEFVFIFCSGMPLALSAWGIARTTHAPRLGCPSSPPERF